MMKAAFFVAVLSLTGSPLLAQPPNNFIFFGGVADGHSAGRNTPVSPVNQSGGGGGGTAGGTSGAGAASNQYGGDADGHSVAGYIQPTASPLLNNGGAGDGHSTSGNTAVAAVTNAGGAGDGWNMDGKAAPPALTNAGGAGDGHSINGREPAGLVVNQRGGNGDGWTSNSVITTLAPPVALPQHFLSFRARTRGNDAELDWKMGAEDGVAHYVVERSANAVSFEAIGQVTYNGDARGAYSFPDYEPLRGHNYYRIRVVSGRGEELTPVRLLVFSEAAPAVALKIFPNPATTRITAVLPAEWQGANTVLNVYSAVGTLVLQQRMTPLGMQEVPLAIDGLAPGVYTIQAATDEASLRAPFVKR